MRIACVRADHSPLVTPVWFIYKDAAIYFTPRSESEWFGCLKADARVALCIDEENLPYRKIIVEDRAKMVHNLGEEDLWRDLYTEIAERYIDQEFARAYVENTIDQLGITSIKEMGKVMGAIKKNHGDNIDLSLVSQIIKKCLS